MKKRTTVNKEMLKQFMSFLVVVIICLSYGCHQRNLNIKYARSTHILTEENGFGFKSIVLSEINQDSSVACVVYYYKNLDAKYMSVINLDKTDTYYFEKRNLLNCEFRTGSKYSLVANFQGFSDTILIIW